MTRTISPENNPRYEHELSILSLLCTHVVLCTGTLFGSTAHHTIASARHRHSTNRQLRHRLTRHWRVKLPLGHISPATKICDGVQTPSSFGAHHSVMAQRRLSFSLECSHIFHPICPPTRHRICSPREVRIVCSTDTHQKCPVLTTPVSAVPALFATTRARPGPFRSVQTASSGA